MNTPAQAKTEQMVFRKTNVGAGRHISVTPGNSTNRHLAYGRIILNGSYPSDSFDTGDRETALICLSGTAAVHVDKESFQLGQYDSLYIPRDSHVDVQASASADIAEFSADVTQRYPLKYVPYSAVSADPSLSFKAGVPGQQRHLNVAIGKNVEAGRLLLGFTISDPGNWTSWPPHEHAEILEEMYVYFDMPFPAYGIQLVYNNTEYPELVTVVREGDAVLMPAGYHPNVAVPGHRIAFLGRWPRTGSRKIGSLG